ncbi:MAG: HAMP domain-containing histidine kinase, partial [Lachnospiraceae bacterium]|nr:HAMP domain-containing histidine kinase [Lachnospiraceae bacterium]
NYDVKIHLEHPKEFQELSECFNQMTEELAGTEMFRSDFINNFSHEFKTPIVSILGFAKLLKSQKLDARQSREYLDIIIEESRRLSELSSTVLNLSKVESLTLLADKTSYSLSEQIREAILLLESKWSKKQIDFDIDMEEVMITASRPLLKQVWMNLLDNAVKFSPSAGCIAVTLRSDNGDAVFAVKDQGEGMDDKIRKYIFDKFYQGDTSHHMEGNGLGLPLVKRILELHKGSISVKSQTGKGSVFIVRLPKDGNHGTIC